jgi:hypothetical protein
MRALSPRARLVATLVTAMSVAGAGVALTTGIPGAEAEAPPAVATVVSALAPDTTAAPDVEPYTGLPTGRRVAVIGDSITDATRSVLHDRLDHRYLVSIDGRPGFKLGQQLPVARVYAAQRPAPDTVVINLGTNDAGRDDAAGTDADLRAMLDTVGAARCVVLVTVTTDTLDPTYNGRADAINRLVLQAAARRDGRIRLADWRGAVRWAYAAGLPFGELTRDRIHPTEVGQRVLTDLVEESLASCPS